MAAAGLVASYLTVAQTDQAMSPLHHLRIVGGEEESCTSRLIKLLHHVKEGDSRSRIQIRRGFIRQD